MEFTREEETRFFMIDSYSSDNLLRCVLGYKWFMEIGATESELIEYGLEWKNYEIIKWLVSGNRSHGVWIMEQAARQGAIDLLEWMLNNGFKLADNIMCHAIEGGHLDMVRWLSNRVYPDGEDLMHVLCRHREDMADSLFDRGIIPTYKMMEEAVEYGESEAISWLVKHGCPWDKSLIIKAIERGQNGIAKWMIENCTCTWR